MIKRASLTVAMALLLVGLAGRAEAVVMEVMVDPGAIGGPSNSPLVSEEFFTGLRTTSFHYVFEDMKHVEATLWGWWLPIDFNLGGPLSISWLFYLTDMFGDEIDGTRREGSGPATGFPSTIRGDNITPPAPVVAYGLFLEITPTQNIQVNVFVDGLVSERGPDVTLPEPTTIALFGFGLAGLGLAGLRGTARRRYRATGE